MGKMAKSTKSSTKSTIVNSDSGSINDDCGSNDNDDNDGNDNNDDNDDNDGNNDNVSSENGSDDDDKEEQNGRIVTNIPVMLIICDQLRRTLKRQKQKNNKIKSVLSHYKYCNDCDITNNNSRELNLTLARIDESDIKFINNNCDIALEAYLNMTPYPKKTKNEFIKINHMTQNLFYTGDILLQYSTKLEPIIEDVEPKKSRQKVNTIAKTKTPTKTNVKVTKKSLVNK